MTARRYVSVAAVLVSAGLVLAQPPAKEATKKDTPAKKEPAKPAAGSLEDTLEKSLRNSADIKAAEAKVRDAEAELNRVRHQVLTKATALHADLNMARRMLTLATETLARLRSIRSAESDLVAAQTAVEKHRGEVEKLETELKSLRGEFAINRTGSFAFSPEGTVLYGAIDGTVRIWDAADGSLLNNDPTGKRNAGAAKVAPVQATMMERVKKLLDQEVDLELGGESIHRTMQFLLEAAKSDIPLRNLPSDQPIEMHPLKGKLTVGAWIQAIEDCDPRVRIVVRDYGLLVTTKEREPDGAVRAVDVWKASAAKTKEPKGG